MQNLTPNTTYYFRAASADNNDQSERTKIYSVTLPKASTVQASIEASKVGTEVGTPTKTVDQKGLINQTSTNNTQPNVCSYTVASGDTLWSIAKKVYNDGSQYQKIVELNKDKNTKTLKIGEELKTCEGSQVGQNTNDSQPVTAQGNSQPASRGSATPLQGNDAPQNSATKTFHWWNPFSWF